MDGFSVSTGIQGAAQCDGQHPPYGWPFTANHTGIAPPDSCLPLFLHSLDELASSLVTPATHVRRRRSGKASWQLPARVPPCGPRVFM